MTIEEAVRGLLVASVDITTLVSDRIYPSQAPESAGFPRVIYQEADRQTVMTHSGPVQTNRYTMDLSCYAADYATAKRLAKLIRRLLLGYKGTPSGVRVMGVFGESEADEIELPQHGDERGVFGVSLSLALWFRDPE